MIAKECVKNKLEPTQQYSIHTHRIVNPSFNHWPTFCFPSGAVGSLTAETEENHISSAAGIQWAAPRHTSRCAPPPDSRFRFSKSIFVSKLWL